MSHLSCSEITCFTFNKLVTIQFVSFIYFILLLTLEKSLIVQILLYGSDNHNLSMNKIIIFTVIDFIIQSKRFEDPLIQ